MSTQDHDNQRYHAAAHAMQTGVKAVAHYEPSETTPASLRVGVNAAHVSMAALTTLLLDKGIITMDEYTAANADAMETEAEAYRQRLAKHLGGETKVTLA
jgi:hypothetical protein